MLAYATERRLAGRRSSPQAMLLIVSAHVALLAAVMSAKMEMPRKIIDRPITMDMIKDPPPPPPLQKSNPKPQPQPQVTDQWIDHPQSHVQVPTTVPVNVDTTGTTTETLPVAGGGTSLIPTLPPLPPIAPIRHDARLLTSPEDLKPPYPNSKLLSGEEANLHLRVAIDERGRVTAVDPVGNADPAFLDAARRFMIAHWRYQPATEDGRPVATSTVITLRFQLDG